MSQRDDDIAALRRLLNEALKASDLGDVDLPDWYDAFGGMLGDLTSGKWEELTEKQRAWVRGVTSNVFDEPEYLNLVSAGKVPRGLREVETPAVLQNLPKKPPRKP